MMKVSGFLLFALAAQAAAFQPVAVSKPTNALMMSSGQNDYLDNLKKPSSVDKKAIFNAAATASTTKSTPAPVGMKEDSTDDNLSKVAISAKGIGKLFQDLGEEVAGQVQAKWDKQRLHKLQKARVEDVASELTDLSAQWDECTLEQRERLLEEAFTTTFKLLQSVQNQQDNDVEMMSEDIKDLEALANKRIVLKKEPTKGELAP